MRGRRLVVAMALVAGALAAPGGAQAAKVTETAAGGAVPNATGGGALAISRGLFTQTFSLQGSKVKGKQVLDVNLTLNGTGSAPGAADDLAFQLSAPKGDNAFFGIATAQSFTNVTLDDQSKVAFCNPFARVSSRCNYLTGVNPAVSGSGTALGTVRGFLNQVFRGLNPKGTWTLDVYDIAPNPPATPETTLLGASTLEVKTGKKFAKEGNTKGGTK